jgi:hypothetical protein
MGLAMVVCCLVVDIVIAANKIVGRFGLQRNVSDNSPLRHADQGIRRQGGRHNTYSRSFK